MSDFTAWCLVICWISLMLTLMAIKHGIDEVVSQLRLLKLDMHSKGVHSRARDHREQQALNDRVHPLNQ